MVLEKSAWGNQRKLKYKKFVKILKSEMQVNVKILQFFRWPRKYESFVKKYELKMKVGL